MGISPFHAAFQSIAPLQNSMAQGQLLRAHSIMQHALALPCPRVELFNHAHAIVRDLRPKLHDIADELTFPADLLNVELTARRLDLAHARRDYRMRRVLIDELHRSINQLSGNHHQKAEPERELIGSMWADATKLLARMNLTRHALREAQAFIHHEIFSKTKAAESLAASPEFSEMYSHSPGNWLERFKVALHHAHSDAASHTFLAGLFGGLLFANVQAFVDSHGASPWVFGLGAMTGIAAHKLKNGFVESEGSDAKSAKRDTSFAKDTASFVAARASDTLLWGAGTTFLTTAVSSAGQTIIAEKGRLAASMYSHAVEWLWQKMPPLLTDSLHSSASLGNVTAAQIIDVLGHGLYYTAMTAAGVHFASSLLFHRSRERIKSTAPLAIVPAILLGANIGMSIMGTEDLESRMGRGVMAVGEGLAVFLMTGVVSLARKKSLEKSLQSTASSIAQADHSYLVASAILSGLTSAMGGYMQKDARPEDISQLALLSMAITYSMWPIAIFVSGVARRNIDIGRGITESWEDSIGKPIHQRFAEAAVGGAAAFWTPYLFNRTLRVPTIDIPAAVARTAVGWDSNLGFLLYGLISFLSANPTATMMFPEVGGQDWQYQGLLEALREKDRSKLVDFLHKATRRLPVFHPFYPHSLKDRLYPLLAIQRIVSPPSFPLKPETFTLALLHQIIQGANGYNLRSDEMDFFLRTTHDLAHDPKSFDLAQSLVQLLHLARDSAPHRHRIEIFFKDHPEIDDLLAIDPKLFPPPTETRRRQRRREVRKRLHLPEETYVARVHEHRWLFREK
ncbi:MAG: hypothetical protein HY540_05010 [Deltaproteobacteria bacterium]|nr:hypothetical protein [Deltaproteobacteria bacterium]